MSAGRGRRPLAAQKRWNYWTIPTETHLFSATISQLDYARLVFIYYADFTTGQFIAMVQMLPPRLPVP